MPPRSTLTLALLSLSLAVAAQSPPQAPFERFVLGNAEDVKTTTKGGLLLAGGGTDQPDAFKWLIDQAGGGDIVIIRASGTDAYNPFIAKLGTADSIETIIFRHRDAASNPEVLARLNQAEAIFLAGGDQGNYVRYWKDTPVETAINDAAKRGVPIGGTSAGLAVLGQFAFAALKDTIQSPPALANPYDEKVEIERDFLRMPFMDNLITDSHLVERDRMGRTLVFLARMVQDGLASPARGLAIDRETAVLVDKAGMATVAGKNTAYFLRTSVPPVECKPNVPLTIGGVATYRVRAGATFNLVTWTGTGGDAYTLSVDKGVVKSSASSIY